MTVTMKVDEGDMVTKIFRKDKMAIRAIICEYETDYDVVDELMQDTFLKAWEKRDNFNAESKMLTWICQIAKNVARDYVKSKRGEPDLVPEETLKCADSDGYTDTLVASVPDDDPAEAYGAQDMLDNAMSMMTPRMAQAVQLRLDGYSNQDIADEMRCSVSRVYAYISESRGYFDQ